MSVNLVMMATANSNICFVILLIIIFLHWDEMWQLLVWTLPISKNLA